MSDNTAPEGGDLAAVLPLVNRIRERVASMDVRDQVDDLRVALRAHRCAPAPSVATPPQEGGTPVHNQRCPDCGRTVAIVLEHHEDGPDGYDCASSGTPAASSTEGGTS